MIFGPGVGFDSVVLSNYKGRKFYEQCRGVSGGVATGTTFPVPPCFSDSTDARVSEELLG